MSQCALCGDKRKNIRWSVNGKPVCKRHYDKLSRIKDVFGLDIELEESEDGNLRSTYREDDSVPA